MIRFSQRGFLQILILFLLFLGSFGFVPKAQADTITSISPKYFKYQIPGKPRESFIVKIIDPATIRQARNDLYGDRNLIIGGIVRSGNDGYNNNGFRYLSWHLDPSTIVLGEVFVPECDTTPLAVEKNLSYYLNKQICPFTAKIKAMYNYPPTL